MEGKGAKKGLTGQTWPTGPACSQEACDPTVFSASPHCQGRQRRRQSRADAANPGRQSPRGCKTDREVGGTHRGFRVCIEQRGWLQVDVTEKRALLGKRFR